MRFLRYSCVVACLFVTQVALSAFDSNDSDNLSRIASAVGISSGAGDNLLNSLYSIESQFTSPYTGSSGANWARWLRSPTTSDSTGQSLANDNFVSVMNVLYNLLGGNFEARGFTYNGGSDWTQLTDQSFGHKNIFSILADSWAMMHNFDKKDFYSLLYAGNSPNYYYFMSQTLTNLYSAVEFSTTDDKYKEDPKTLLDYLDLFYTAATNYFERDLALSEQTAMGASGAAFNTTNIFIYNALSMWGYETGEDLLNNYTTDASSGYWPSPMTQWYGLYSPAMWQALSAFDGVYVDRENRQDGNFATTLLRHGYLSYPELNALYRTINNADDIFWVFNDENGQGFNSFVSDLSSSRFSLYGTAYFRGIINTNVFYTPDQKGRLLNVLKTNEVDEITTAASDSLVDYAKKTNLLTKVDVGQYEEVFDERLDSIKTYTDEIDGLADFSAFDMFDETLEGEAEKLDGFKLGSRSDVIYFNWRPDVGSPSAAPPATVEIVDFSEVPDWWITFKSQYSPWVFGLLKVCVVLGVIYKCYGKIGELVPS